MIATRGTASNTTVHPPIEVNPPGSSPMQTVRLTVNLLERVKRVTVSACLGASLCSRGISSRLALEAFSRVLFQQTKSLEATQLLPWQEASTAA
jgi:hypothetical protein